MLEYSAERRNRLSRAPGAGHVRSRVAPGVTPSIGHHHFAKYGLLGDERDPEEEGLYHTGPEKEEQKKNL